MNNNNVSQDVFEKRKQAKIRINNALIKVNDEAKKVFKSENTIEYLDYMCDQIHFDIYTIMLLFMQPVKLNQYNIRKRAVYVESYNTWIKKSAPVQRGSSGLLIVLPYLSKKTEKIPSVDQFGDLNYDADGNVKMIPELVPFYDLTTGTVFDVTQTNNPELQHNDKDDILSKLRGMDKVKCEECFKELLIKYLATQNCSVYIEDENVNSILRRIKSYATNDKAQVQFIIRSKMSTAETIDRIIYEYASYRLLNKNKYLSNVDRNIIEFMTQSIIYIVMKHFHINNNKQIFDYINNIEVKDKIKILHWILSMSQEMIFNIDIIDKFEVSSIMEYTITNTISDENNRIYSLEFMELTILMSCLNKEHENGQTQIQKDRIIEVIKSNLLYTKNIVVVDYGNSLIHKIDMLSQQEFIKVINDIQNGVTETFYQTSL